MRCATGVECALRDRVSVRARRSAHSAGVDLATAVQCTLEGRLGRAARLAPTSTQGFSVHWRFDGILEIFRREQVCLRT